MVMPLAATLGQVAEVAGLLAWQVGEEEPHTGPAPFAQRSRAQDQSVDSAESNH